MSGADDDRTVIRPGRSAAPAPAASASAEADPLALFGAAAPSAADLLPGPAAAPATAADHDGGNTLPMGTRIGEFEIIRVLGEGGFGIVYLAQDHSLERQIALKEYMPSALAARLGGTQVQVRSERHRDTFEAGRKSFVNEARLLAQFDHPSLVKVFRFWEANGTAYMVMPYYQGITLKQKLLDLGQPPDEEWLMGVLAPLTEALQVIHGENCFHRDIAPDNVILLAGSERPLLLDFGAARRVIGDMTQALTVILKPGYAPVEQYAESPDMKQGAWTDVYALAASVYFAILGKTPPAAVGRLIQDQYVPLVECCAGRYSEGFLRALDRALKVRPEDRTQSIAELREDLGLSGYSVSRGETIMAPARGAAAGRTTTPSARGGAPAGAAGGGKAKWVAAAVGALALAGGGAWLLMPHGKPDTPAANAPAGAAPAVAAAPGSATTPAAPPPAAAPAAAAAAPPAALPAADAPMTAAWDPHAEIDRVLASQSKGFEVEVSGTRNRLRIDKDNLAFQVHSSTAGYVTVFALGPDKSLTRLIPNKETGEVRIGAGQTARMPPTGITIPVGEPAGSDDILVLVSAQPRDYSGLAGHEDGGYLVLEGGPSAATAATPALLGRALRCPGSACDDYGAARFVIDVVR